MVTFLMVLFGASVGAVVYTYLVYPLLLYGWVTIGQGWADLRFILRLPDRRKRKPSLNFPRVSLVIAAHNEEKVIEDKLMNSLALDYPENKLEIIVASDGSTDRTNDLVRKFARHGVKLFDFPDRPGKIGALTRAIERASGQVIVLSDANVMYKPDAVLNLVRHFADPTVGGVCGELKLIGNAESPPGEGMYWRYEVVLKRLESQIDSTLGANGAIYAIRKELFEPPPPYTVCDDFVIPMKIREKGYRIVYEPAAVALEEMAPTMEKEFGRKMRIGAAAFQAIFLTIGLLHPRQGFIAFAYFSHKILRWCVPFFLIIAFVTNLLLLRQGPLYAGLAGAQVVLYGSALLAHLMAKRRRIKWLNLPYYFAYMNLALLLGFFRFLRGQQKAAWESGRS
ncbi:MAG TPA: glycosyltransferase family 2 protein [Armatimonadetes bacterium]|nr:glycosyltransferase family 2 protein [Armatimonadota bacterium]